jgi:hypothetical protein
MSVNLSKTGIVVFQQRQSAQKSYKDGIWNGVWKFMDKSVPVVPCYKYLGLTVFHDKPMQACLADLADKGMRASAALRSKLMHIVAEWDIPLTVCMCKALVLPCVMYGCEIWGADFMNLPTKYDCLTPVIARILKRALGVKLTTQNVLVFREVGLMPMQMLAFRQLVRFWNKLSSMPEDCIAKKAMLQNISLVTSSPIKYDGLWCAGVNYYLHAHHVPRLSIAGCDLTDLVEVDENEVLQGWRQSIYGTWMHFNDPRTHGSENVKLCTYHCWFGDALPDSSRDWKMSRYLSSKMPNDAKRSLARFRLGSHTLPVEFGRRSELDRAHRMCSFCHTSVGDELHVVLECQHVGDRPPCIAGCRNMQQVFGNNLHSMEIVQFLRSLDCGCM